MRVSVFVCVCVHVHEHVSMLCVTTFYNQSKTQMAKKYKNVLKS